MDMEIYICLMLLKKNIRSKGERTMQFKHKLSFIALGGVLVFVGLLGTASISLAQSDVWTTKADMPMARYGLSTSVVNGKIYVIGGAKEGYSSTILTVEEYDPETETWTPKTDMQEARSWLATCAVNGKIYVIGGGKSVLGVGLSTVDEYNPETDAWTPKTDMPTKRFVLSASAVNGKIYAIGGKPAHGVAPLTTVEEYDPATNTWTTKADMKTARFGLSTCAVNGKIYAIGGSPASESPYPGLATVEEYDPATDTWTTKTDMPARRAYFSTSVVNGKIYAIGGGRDLATSGLSTVEEYDPVADTWTPKTDMPTARFLLSTSTVNDRIYAIGGAVTDWNSSSRWQGCSTLEEYNPSTDPTSVGNPSWGQNPTEFLLHQNYPNLFNPTTRISYEIPNQRRVILIVMNLLDQEIRTLVNEERPADHYEVLWDGMDNTGQRIASGVYLYQLEGQDFVQTRKMLLLQ
jgi:N-acetylneuraminic acid mutarotase